MLDSVATSRVSGLKEGSWRVYSRPDRFLVFFAWLASADPFGSWHARRSPFQPTRYGLRSVTYTAPRLRIAPSRWPKPGIPSPKPQKRSLRRPCRHRPPTAHRLRPRPLRRESPEPPVPHPQPFPPRRQPLSHRVPRPHPEPPAPPRLPPRPPRPRPRPLRQRPRQPSPRPRPQWLLHRRKNPRWTAS